MLLNSKEHYDLMDNFDKIFKYEILDKEDKSLWLKGRIYQSGQVNSLFAAFRFGYAAGKQEYQSN